MCVCVGGMGMLGGMMNIAAMAAKRAQSRAAAGPIGDLERKPVASAANAPPPGFGTLKKVQK